MHVKCCPVCQSSAGNLHLVREMMLGTRETFLYSECSDCGCLSLADIPEDLDQYYPVDVSRRKARPSSFLRKLRNALYLSRYSFLVNWRQRNDLDVIRRIKLKKNMTFLEVGSKSGSLLGDLHELGYDVHGVNYFAKEDLKDGEHACAREQHGSTAHREFGSDHPRACMHVVDQDRA